MLYTRSSQRFLDELRQFIADHYTGREQEGAYNLRALQTELELMKNADMLVSEEAAPFLLEEGVMPAREAPCPTSANRKMSAKRCLKKARVTGVVPTTGTVEKVDTVGAAKAASMDIAVPHEPDLQAYLRDNQSPTFGRVLVQMMVERGLEARDLYRRVFMDRRLFSKILSQPDYEPSKETALLLCLGLHLSVDEADDFLRTAGLALSNAQQRDLAVRFFLVHQRYDVIMLNEMLLELGLKPLLRG